MITYTLKRPLGIISTANIPRQFDNADCFDSSTHLAIISKMCEDVKSNYAYRVSWCLHYEDWDKLLDMEVDPGTYSDYLSYQKDVQINALIKKYPLWHTSHDPELQAKKTFLACEATCRDTNFRFWSPGKIPGVDNCILHIAQRKISSILGKCPSMEDLEFRFGPGASYSVKHNTSALDKLSSNPDVTPSCHALATEMLRTCPGWRKNSDFLIAGPPSPLPIQVVKGDRLSFVPKTAKTHRPIGINPLLNGVIQKGIGAVIRRRLRPYLDLNNLQEEHRVKARSASLYDYLSTIDMKSASDTIAYALVQSLLPNDWFSLLHNARSPAYYIEGDWYTYQKFSAMGNGYTFELETLIFFALCYATCVHLGLDTSELSVYGDDIIIPTAAVTTLKRVMATCGFSVNEEKSFTSGPFRESCGGDFFNGIDVRPFYLKERISYRTLFLMRNFLEKKGSRFLFPKTFSFLTSLIGPKNVSFFSTSNSLDDGALFSHSAPIASYNRIVAFEKGRKKSLKVKGFGASYGLYKNQFSGPSESEDVPYYKTRIHRVEYRLYRHVHI